MDTIDRDGNWSEPVSRRGRVRDLKRWLPRNVDRALANDLMERAIAYCGEKKFGGDTREAIEALRKGNCDVCGVLSSCLVQEVGEYLGSTDRMVKAVYQVEPESTLIREEPGVKPASSRRAGINLVAWVDRKSAALVALGSNAGEWSGGVSAYVRLQEFHSCLLRDADPVGRRKGRAGAPGIRRLREQPIHALDPGLATAECLRRQTAPWQRSGPRLPRWTCL